MFRPLLALLLLPASALAECPGAEALERGVRFTLAGGETETFRRENANVVSATWAEAGVPVTRVMLAQGLYLIEVIDIEDGDFVPSTRTTYAFPLPPGGMPRALPNASWVTQVVVNAAGEFSTETQSYRFGKETRVTFGTCSYDAVPVEIRYPGGEDATVEELIFLPALGLSYLVRSAWDGGEDTFDYLRIEALK